MPSELEIQTAREKKSYMLSRSVTEAKTKGEGSSKIHYNVLHSLRTVYDVRYVLAADHTEWAGGTHKLRF